MKETKNQGLGQRHPRQERALHKVGLILEAAMRLLEQGGLPALTTNAVAEKAGVSIGTLYQYFANKEAILDALADRETADTGERVIAALSDAGAASAEDRVGGVVRAVSAAYGGRKKVHRLVMEHSLQKGGKRLAPLIERLIAYLATDNRPVEPLDRADAFVLTHAFAGVMRAMVLSEGEDVPARAEIEDALRRLILGFVAG